MADSSENSRAALKRPPLEAVAKDEERREKAKQNLVRALQSYINKLDHANDRDAHRETELFCNYARENYASRAEPYFEAMSPMDPEELFRGPEESRQVDLSDLGDLSGLLTINDVFELARSVKVRRPDHWPDPPIYRDGESLELRNVLRGFVVGEHESFRWLLEEPEAKRFRLQIRECVKECLSTHRREYERRFPPVPEFRKGDFVTAENTPPLKASADPSATQRRRGPATDYATAMRVVEIVTRVAQGRARIECLEEICEALDAEQVKRPKTWKKKGYETWCDCLDLNPHLVKEAIRHHFDVFETASKTIL